MSLRDANAVISRDDFVAFARSLRADLEDDPTQFENADLGTYLGAIAAWVEDMDGYFQNIGRPEQSVPSWRLFAQILSAAAQYE
jgi:hypothetical protein